MLVFSLPPYKPRAFWICACSAFTGGGLVGKVVRVDDIYADVELAPGMKVKAVKATLTDVIDPMTAKPAND